MNRREDSQCLSELKSFSVNIFVLRDQRELFPPSAHYGCLMIRRTIGRFSFPTCMYSVTRNGLPSQSVVPESTQSAKAASNGCGISTYGLAFNSSSLRQWAASTVILLVTFPAEC